MDFNKEYKLLDRSEDMNDELIDRPEPIYHTVLSAKFVASFLKRMFYSTWNPTVRLLHTRD
jgi:hypothetical protein